jgi:oxalate decarboxylase/phosphoglucose isomerase-like protein (cupin superfamily)
VAGDFDGEPEFPQLGIAVYVLGPGEPMAMYHWEADQEVFLLVSGEALLIVEGEERPLRAWDFVEGEERPLRAWDFVHCPPETKHVIVGAGDGPCVLVAVGARDRTRGANWGGYTVDEAALRHGAGVEAGTDDPKQAYARFRPSVPTRYREGWLPKLGRR